VKCSHSEDSQKWSTDPHIPVLRSGVGEGYWKVFSELPGGATGSCRQKYTIAKLLWAESKKWTGLDISKWD